MAAFPSDPTNGQKANVNGVTYTYNSTLTAWTVTSTFSGNVTVDQINANAIVSAGLVSGSTLSGTSLSATGNVTGGNVISVGLVSVTGTVTGGNLATGGTLSVTGNITASNINPSGNGTVDLGSTGSRWRNVYTSDLHLNNGQGDWTIVEGEQDLFIYNNKNKRVYKFALIEVEPDQATPKINDMR